MQNGWRCTGGGTDSTHTFAYDSVGNRRDHGGSYTTGNRITAFNGCTYGTDYDGNVTSRSYAAAPCPNQNLTFTWTADNRLASFAVAGGASVTLDYDAFGRLVRRSVNGSARSYFLWDGDNLLAELDGTAAGKVAEYSWYGLDNLHATVRGAFAHHAQSDGLGNVRALTNLSGLVTRTNTYDEWGRLIAATDTALGDSARVRWKGALWLGPEAELYYMRNRWYEPWTGRFLSEDPIGLDGGVDPYLFAGANPVGGFDPLGLCTSQDYWTHCTTTPINITAPAPPPGFFGAGRTSDGAQFNCMGGAVCVSGTSGSFGTYSTRAQIPRSAPPDETPPPRRVGQCFAQNTAPVTNLLRRGVAAGLAILTGATAAVGWVVRAEGNAQVMRAFAAGDASAFAGGEVAGTIGGMRLAPSAMVSGGATMTTVSSIVTIGLTGFLGSYYFYSAVVCSSNSGYGG
jgi:RHS repeat-associated protein